MLLEAIAKTLPFDILMSMLYIIAMIYKLLKSAPVAIVAHADPIYQAMLLIGV